MALATFNVRGTLITVDKEMAQKSPILDEQIRSNTNYSCHPFIDCDPQVFHQIINFLSYPNYKVLLKHKPEFALLGIPLEDTDIDGQIVSCKCGVNFKVISSSQLYCSDCESPMYKDKLCHVDKCRSVVPFNVKYCIDHKCDKCHKFGRHCLDDMGETTLCNFHYYS